MSLCVLNEETYFTKTKDVYESMEIDDAAWVMSSTFMIFGKFLFCRFIYQLVFLANNLYKLANW